MRRIRFLPVLACLLSACGRVSSIEPGGGDPSASPETPVTDVETSLHALGVATESTPRVDADGVAYPQEYAPFGQRFEMTQQADGSYVFGRPAKLLLGGFKLANENAPLVVLDNFHVPPTGSNLVTPFILQQRSPPWITEHLVKNAQPETQRDATAADVDGDGQDEIVFVYRKDGVVHLDVQNGDDGGAGDLDKVIPAPAQVSDVRVRAGDFDGDGRAEVVVAFGIPAPLGGPGAAHVEILDDAAANYAVVAELDLVGTLVGGSVTLVIATGSVDYDGADELALVMNEQIGQASGSTITGTTSYHVYDDMGHAFAPLGGGPVSATVDDVTTTAVVASVAIGDLDGDQAGEVVLAGIASMTRTSEDVTHLLVELDDAVRGLALVAQSVSLVSRPGSSSDAEEDPWLVRFVSLNLLDLDGDDHQEIQVNDLILPGVPGPGKRWDAMPEAWRLSSTVLFPEQDSSSMFFDRSSSVIAVADVTGDGREDVVSYRTGSDEIFVFGLDEEDHLTRLLRMAVQFDNPFFGINPILVPVRANLNGQVTDSSVYEYDGNHELVFTEPILIAVLAAPPCQLGLDQNYGDCTTTWGLSKSTGVEAERELKFSAGFAFGREWKVGGWGKEWKIKLMASLARTKTDAYELTKSVSFTTGPLEDSVVFSSIPLDSYVYQVIASPNAQQIGTQVRMCLPREAVVRLAERSYFNSHQAPGGFPVGANVFQHVPGELDTYPDAETKDALLRDMRSQLEDARVDYNLNQDNRAVFDPVEALLGLETESVGVGEGSGSTEVAIDLTRTSGEGRALSLGAEFEGSVTGGGWKFELDLGFEATWTTKVSYGTSTNFVGTVGSIGPNDFAENQYRFGLFTYIQSDPDSGREFQVVNYWVE